MITIENELEALSVIACIIIDKQFRIIIKDDTTPKKIFIIILGKISELEIYQGLKTLHKEYFGAMQHTLLRLVFMTMKFRSLKALLSILSNVICKILTSLLLVLLMKKFGNTSNKLLDRLSTFNFDKL